VTKPYQGFPPVNARIEVLNLAGRKFPTQEFGRSDLAPARYPAPITEPSSGLPLLIGKPFTFELHRAEVAQRRVQPPMVVEGQPTGPPACFSATPWRWPS
jgi:hypothetical protein